MSQFGLKQDTINQINQVFSAYSEIIAVFSLVRYKVKLIV